MLLSSNPFFCAHCTLITEMVRSRNTAFFYSAFCAPQTKLSYTFFGNNGVWLVFRKKKNRLYATNITLTNCSQKNFISIYLHELKINLLDNIQILALAIVFKP